MEFKIVDARMLSIDALMDALYANVPPQLRECEDCGWPVTECVCHKRQCQRCEQFYPPEDFGGGRYYWICDECRAEIEPENGDA